jgi:hypothetical protein
MRAALREGWAAAGEEGDLRNVNGCWSVTVDAAARPTASLSYQHLHCWTLNVETAGQTRYQFETEDLDTYRLSRRTSNRKRWGRLPTSSPPYSPCQTWITPLSTRLSFARWICFEDILSSWQASEGW